jgi:hypothetical protein
LVTRSPKMKTTRSLFTQIGSLGGTVHLQP